MPQRPDHLSSPIADPRRASVASLVEEYSIVFRKAYGGTPSEFRRRTIV